MPSTMQIKLISTIGIHNIIIHVKYNRSAKLELGQAKLEEQRWDIKTQKYFAVAGVTMLIHDTAKVNRLQ